MKTINLKPFPCFKNKRALQRLNELLMLHDNIMPHQIAIATGCGLEESMGLLMFLSSISAAEPLLLVYHISDGIDPPSPFLARDITKGIPDLPIVCSICDKEIDNYNELRFDFIFKMQHPITFIE